ncbi:MAG TPA: class I SAM-dependent methyltransferase [Kiritimatiellia bacterium]|nr:class I SAM-dependent methyltransferase [Kiritimatiellia bacterium]HMP34381.1 class I SAM-dependent methyltransferase [Kiritimatiellia bacterium]
METIRYILVYLRLAVLLPVPVITRVASWVSSSMALKLEVVLIGWANRLFRPRIPIEPFLDRDAYYAYLDVDDFRTLGRKLGLRDEWVAGLAVLDVGCGHGKLTRRVRELGATRAVGLDIAASSIAYAHQELERRPLSGVEYLEGSVYQLPFPDATFDAIVSQVVFEHLMDIPLALAELRRVLKPGGRFYFTIDSIRCRYGSHLGHYILVPWPLLFFSEAALEIYWKRAWRETLREHHLDEAPDFFEYGMGLPSLNRVRMAEVDRMIVEAGFEIERDVAYADEKPLVNHLPFLRRFPLLFEFIRGSKAYLLRKPSA